MWFSDNLNWLELAETISYAITHNYYQVSSSIFYHLLLISLWIAFRLGDVHETGNSGQEKHMS